MDRDFGLRLPHLLFGVVYAFLFFFARRLFHRHPIDDDFLLTNTQKKERYFRFMKVPSHGLQPMRLYSPTP
ncbi:hypothetical protein [Lihuaxuella thermophila]|nr:hypothetical protein [Lihuaxuella thermophila]